MKHVIKLTAIIFVLVGINGFISCKKTIHTPTLEERIVGKWTMKTAIGSYTQLGVTNKATTTFTSSDYFDFKADRTVAIVETGKTYSGKWRVQNNRIFFEGTNYIDFSKGLEVKKLTSNDLELYYTETNGNISSEQWLNLAK